MPSLPCADRPLTNWPFTGNAPAKLRPFRRSPKTHKAFSGAALHRVYASTDTEAVKRSAAPSARIAVEQGLEAFSKGNSSEALSLFQKSLKLDPNDDEARAALYNSACCLAKEKKWQAAANAIAKACNEYGLKYTVALKDPDLRQLRDRREWLDATENIKGGVSKAGLVELRSEAKAPFRLIRMFLTVGAGVAAVVSLAISLYALKETLQGKTESKDLNPIFLNLAINGVGIVGTNWLFQRDLRNRRRDRASVEREEALARLQIKIGKDKVVPIAKFRGTTRPVLIIGSKGHIQKVLKAAEPLVADLRLRGVSVITLQTDDADFTQQLRNLKEEFRSGSSGGKGFAASKPAPKPVQQAKQVSNQDKRWQLEAHEPAEWLEWVEVQKKTANVKGDNVFVQIQLDGTVRSSGVGSPPWERFMGDLAPLDDIRTKFTDGLGRQ